jgi:predicted nucleic acid-binding Zn ribbon protein
MATNCHEMKTGQTYVCDACGLELEVVKECRDAGTPADECGCHEGADAEPCVFSCCGQSLRLK